MPPKLERQASVPLEYRQPVADPRPYITREGGLRPDIAKYPYSPFANNGQGGALSQSTLKLYTNVIQNLLANYDGKKSRTFIEEDFRSPRKVLKVLDEAAKDPASDKALSMSTQKTRINAILWNISEYDPTGDRKPGLNTEVGKIYFEARDKQFKDIDKKATFKQTEKTIPWDKLKNLWEQYPEGSMDRAILAVYSLLSLPPSPLEGLLRDEGHQYKKNEYFTNNILIFLPRPVLVLFAVGVLFEEVFGGCGVLTGITAVLGGFDDFPNFLLCFALLQWFSCSSCDLLCVSQGLQ